jgi:hypothetical protein
MAPAERPSPGRCPSGHHAGAAVHEHGAGSFSSRIHARPGITRIGRVGARGRSRRNMGSGLDRKAWTGRQSVVPSGHSTPLPRRSPHLRLMPSGASKRDGSGTDPCSESRISSVMPRRASRVGPSPDGVRSEASSRSRPAEQGPPRRPMAPGDGHWTAGANHWRPTPVSHGTTGADLNPRAVARAPERTGRGRSPGSAPGRAGGGSTPRVDDPAA